MSNQKHLPCTNLIINNIHQTNQHDIEANLYTPKEAEAHWLGPPVLAANDGLVSTASLMLGMGAVSQDINAMIIAGFLGLIAGACTAALAEYISIDSALIEGGGQRGETKRDPLRAAMVSASAFAVGAMVPLTVVLIMEDYYKVTLGVVEGPISVVLAVFGWIGAFLDDAPGFRAAFRVLLWGWVGMVVTFGLLINSDW